MRKLALLSQLVLAVCCVNLWAQNSAPSTQQFPVTAHVTASRMLYRPDSEPITGVPRLRVSAIINSKIYQLDQNTFSGKARLLHLGNYPAALEYHPLKNASEFTEKCLLKMPDGKVMKFTVTGISELPGHAAAPEQ